MKFMGNKVVFSTSHVAGALLALMAPDIARSAGPSSAGLDTSQALQQLRALVERVTNPIPGRTFPDKVLGAERFGQINGQLFATLFGPRTQMTRISGTDWTPELLTKYLNRISPEALVSLSQALRSPDSRTVNLSVFLDLSPSISASPIRPLPDGIIRKTLEEIFKDSRVLHIDSVTTPPPARIVRVDVTGDAETVLRALFHNTMERNGAGDGKDQSRRAHFVGATHVGDESLNFSTDANGRYYFVMVRQDSNPTYRVRSGETGPGSPPSSVTDRMSTLRDATLGVTVPGGNTQGLPSSSAY